MTIVVDTNIVFSALLNADGSISSILLNSFGKIRFVAPSFMVDELDRYDQKIRAYSKHSHKEIGMLKRILLHHIELIDMEQVADGTWKRAFELTKHVDEFDTPFVALALELNALLWTGDKKLVRGLKRSGFDKAISTPAIMDFLEKQ